MIQRVPLVVAFLLVLVVPGSAQAAFPGSSGKLAAAQRGGGSATEFDIRTLNPDGTGLTAPSPATGPDEHPAWSPDGRRIAFNSARDGDIEIYAMDADGSDLTRLTFRAGADEDPSWSPDGTRIVFESRRGGQDDLWVMDADGSDPAPLVSHPAEDIDPAWSPDGTKIAFASDREESACDPDDPFCTPELAFQIFTIDLAGGAVSRVVSGAASTPTECANGDDLHAPSWDPTARYLAYERISEDLCSDESLHSIATTRSGSLFQEDLGGAPVFSTGTAWSPDGTEVAFFAEGGFDLTAARVDGTRTRAISDCCWGWPDWQPLPGYPRPVAATPVQLPLVIAYAPCTSPNRTHAAPLAHPSCNPPVQRSGELTVGTFDANGRPANSVGFATLRVHRDDPTTSPDEADVVLTVDISDVRRRSDLEDYTGELLARPGVRITDRDNTSIPVTSSAATAVDSPFSYAVPCHVTADPGSGSSCALATTANAVLPGSVKGRMRSIWDLNQFALLDGGPDGDADTADNSVFAVQGVFVP